MNSNRIIWIDSLKGLLMILVVLGHSIQYVVGPLCNDNHVWNIIYSFHMPAFMAISGYLAYARKASFERRFRQLMIPFLLWSIIKISLSYPFTLKDLFNIILYPDMFFWFLWALFWISMLFEGVRYLTNKLSIDIVWGLIPTMLLFVFIMVFLNVNYFGIQFVGYYFIFYVLGFFICRYNSFRIHGFLLCLCTLSWFVLALFWKMHSIPTWIPSIPMVPNSIIQYFYRGITALLGVLAVINGASKLFNNDSIINQLIVMIGRISLGIYVVHQCFMIYVIRCFRNVFNGFPNNIILIVVTFIVSMILSVFIVKVFCKNRFVYKYLFGNL